MSKSLSFHLKREDETERYSISLYIALKFLHPKTNKGNKAKGIAIKGVIPELKYIKPTSTISKLSMTANDVSKAI